MGVSPGRPLHLKPGFDCQGTRFGILSRSQFRGKVVGALAGILVGGSGAYHLNGKLHHVRLILSGRFISGAIGYSAS